MELVKKKKTKQLSSFCLVLAKLKKKILS